MKRIGFVGVPGAGKSSVARGVAAKAFDRIGRVELVSEYARRFFSKYGKIEHVFDQYKIMQKQLEWENVIPSNDTDVSITDSPIHMGFLYALDIRDVGNLKDAMYVNDIFKMMNKMNCPPRYDIIFHLPPLWKPLKDGVRPDKHFQDDWRNESDRMIQFIFRLFPPINLVILKTATLEDRVEECLKKCQELLQGD